MTSSGACRSLLVAWFPIVIGCATIPVAPPDNVPRISPEALAAGITEADRLAARGSYLRLREAAAAYSSLLQLSNDQVLTRKALENYLMIALREIELRLPDSGARDAAQTLAARVSGSYAAAFSVIDAVKRPAAADTGAAGPAKAGPDVLVRQPLEEQRALALELEKEWPASAMKAYFYIVAALDAGMADALKPQLDVIVSGYPDDFSLRYRLQVFRPTFSTQASRALIDQEATFGEVHLLLGTRAVLDGRMADAHRELTRANQLLPDSAAIGSALSSVKMSYARYAEALTLYDRVLAVWPDAMARLGRAKALSHLLRHEDAIAMLDELLKDARNAPGEKYYWRSWNRLRLGHTQAAYDDAMAALNVMRNDEVYRLAGIASLRVGRPHEARKYFEGALEMNADDCDSLAYLGQLDTLEKNAKPAFDRYTGAVACYDEQISRMATDLARHENDVTGLSNGLITSLRGQITEMQTLRAASLKHAASIAIGAGFKGP